MPKGKILIKDDQTQALARAISILADEGFEVAAATSEIEALAKLEKGICDLVILNARAPQTRGILPASKEIDPYLSTLIVVKPKGVDSPLGILGGFASKMLSLDRGPEALRYAVSQADALREAAKAELISPLVDIGGALAAEAEPSKLVNLVTEKLAKTTAAEQVSVMLWDKETQELSMKFTSGAQSVVTTGRGVEGMARWVASKMEPMVILDSRSTAPQLQQEIATDGISSAFSLPLLLRNSLIGVVNFIKLRGSPPFSQYDVRCASAFCGTLALALENARLHSSLEQKEAATRQYEPQLEQRQQEIKALNTLLQTQQAKIMEMDDTHRSLGERYMNLLRSLVTLIETAEPLGQAHSEMVARWIVSVAEAMGVATDGLAEVAYLHDIGMFIPQPIFSKSTQLSAEEQKQLANHPILGEELAKSCGLPPEVGLSIRHHHENYDGTGYPDGLAGDKIPIASRLLRVVDIYAEMVSAGPHKEALPQQAAFSRLKAGAGKDFDPQVVDAFTKLVGGKEVPPEIELASTISHELRSPLTFLVGYSELLASQKDLPPDAQERAAALHSEALHMSKLVEDLLNLSRIESGRVELKSEPVDLGELVKRSITKAQITSSQHQLETRLPEGPVVVRADADKVLQVLDNLLTNAIRYSPDGGRVVVAVDKLDEQVRVSVADPGIGIPKDKLEMVFEKFYRVDSPLKNKVQGTGLGLSLCQRIVEAHGGHIWAESREGEGSTFYFTLPSSRI